MPCLSVSEWSDFDSGSLTDDGVGKRFLFPDLLLLCFCLKVSVSDSLLELTSSPSVL